MENQILIAAINEAIQKAVPTIVEEVSQKLNNKETPSRRQQWENLTLDDIKRLMVSEDFRDRCSAASHPKANDSILKILENDPDRRVKRVVKRVRSQNFFNTSRGISDYTNIIKNGETKTERKNARNYLEQELLSGNLDGELHKNDSRKIFSSAIPTSELIDLSKNKDPYTSYCAGLMLKYRFLNFVEINAIDSDLLTYAFGKYGSDRWGIIRGINR